MRNFQMKKKIGFIDLHIDEWHANNYPGWIRSRELAKDFELAYAWEESPNPQGRPLAEWCKDFGMIPAAFIEEVVEKSDAVIVLAPSNPEVHARLAELPLKSGKPVFVDKPFAPNRVEAEAMFALARQYNTPLMSSSALRYGNGLRAALKDTFAGKKADFAVTTGGGGNFPEYAIHQLEMIVAALGTGARRVKHTLDGKKLHMLIGYDDGRYAAASYHGWFSYTAALAHDDVGCMVTDMDQMFENLLDDVLEFFNSGVSPIPAEETIEIAAILGAAVEAMSCPGTWVNL